MDGELIILETGKKGETPGVIALDRKTGELRWGALEGPAGYSSPIVVELAGVRQYVFFRRVATEVVSLSTEGKLLWRYPTSGLSIIVTPIFLPPDRFFVATSEDAFGGLMIRVVAKDGDFHAEEAWSERLMRNHFSASVLVDGHLYGFDNATFRCIDAETGDRRWAKRGLGKGSLVAAGGLLFVLADDGTLVLVRATPDAYVEAGRVQAMEGRSWTAPSLAHGRLYVRDFDELVSFDVRGKGQPSAAPVRAAARSSAPITSKLTLEKVLERYRKARGGVERWRKLRALKMSGRYAAFSEVSDFDLIRQRGDLYRLDFALLGGPAIRARDAQGTWGQHSLLKPEPGRIDEDPYKSQFERESLFQPLLLDPEGKGLQIALLGPGDVDGVATVDLRLTLPGGEEEIWHLNARTFLEVAVDSQIYDFTQFQEPIPQRAFFADFREVDGIVLPFQIDLEFGARLETMTVDEVVVDPEIDEARFRAPEPPADDDKE